MANHSKSATPGYERVRELRVESPGSAYCKWKGRAGYHDVVDSERVVAQPGDFHGVWITSDLSGPFKGGAGTRGC